MSTHFGTTWIKSTRKPHHCHWCGKRIEAKSAASYQSGIFEGDFWSGHAHPECQAAIDASDYRDLEEGWSPGDYARGRRDEDYELPPEFSADYRGSQLSPPSTTEVRR